MEQDNELLRRYAESRSEEAFTEIVRRHIDLVFSAALRQVNGDTALAQDVTQTVFAELARKAESLASHPVLTGWLYRCAHFVAAKAVRTEIRRHQREQEAGSMNELLQSTSSEPHWEELRPVLDALVNELSETDRQIILLRFFENRPLAEVGRVLGLNEDTARKRVSRALDKLRALCAKRGLVAAGSLGSVISTHAVQSAPPGLIQSAVASSLAGLGSGSLVATSGVVNLQASIAGALIVAAVLCVAVLQQRALGELRRQNALLAAEETQLKTGPAHPADPAPLKTDGPGNLNASQLSELLRLRGEVGLQRETLQKLHAQLLVKQNTAAARAAATASYFPKEVWGNAGNATPEAAIQSHAWAQGQLEVNHDFNRIREVVGKDRWSAITNSPFFPKDLNANLDSAAELFGKLDGLRVVNVQTITNDEVLVTYMMFSNHGTNDAWVQEKLKKTGNEWN